MAKFEGAACDLFKPSVIKTAFEEASKIDPDTRYVIITDSKAKIPTQSNPSTTIINVGDESLDGNEIINLIELQREFTSLDLSFQSHIKK